MIPSTGVKPLMEMSKGYADIDYLDRKAELLYTVKEREHSHLQLAAGHRVLDVGFGPGADTVAWPQWWVPPAAS